MKLTALICLLGSGLATAATIQPDIHLTFDEVGSPVPPATSTSDADRNAAMLTNTGTATSSQTTDTDYTLVPSGRMFEDGNKNYVGTGHSFKNYDTGNSKTRYISITSADNLTLDKSFTFSFAAMVQNNTRNGDKELFSINTADSAGVYLETNSSGVLFLKSSSDFTLTADGTISTAQSLYYDTFHRYTMVYTAATGDSLASFTLYADDTKLGKWSLELGDDITSKAVTLQIGYSSVGSNVVQPMFIDELCVYSTALNAKEVASLVNNTTGIAVPEPATATLSLLALAGLAARRRRQ